MKLRFLSFVALILAVIAVAGWMWLGRDGDRTAPNPAGSEGSAPDLPNGSAAAPASPTVASKPGTGAPDQESVKPAEPIRMTTSVMPGLPMVRSTPAPPRPAEPVRKARGVAAADARPDWQVTGTAELGKVQAMLRDFRTRMGGNPVGSNAEIMKAVMGGNPVNARLGPPEGQSVNEQGELVDQWGTPYFFHQNSKDSMEIRSAGPDRKMWTSDDLVSK